MKNYIIRRFTCFLFIFLLLLITIFTLTRWMPGSPFLTDFNSDPLLIEKNYYLDAPIYKQFIFFISKIIEGSWGNSLKFEGISVYSAIIENFPLSFTLGFIAFICSLVIGVTLGMLAAYYNRTRIDKVIFILSMCGRSLPGLLVASFIQYVFSIYWPILPIAQVNSPLSLVLPIFSLCIIYGSFITQLVRNLARESLQEPYIQTAMCKPISTCRFLFHHVLRNIAAPLITAVGPIIARLITGCFLAEKIYALPGLGSIFFTSIQYRDYPMIIGITLFCGSILIWINALVDFILPIIDPRIRLKKSSFFLKPRQA